MQFSVISSLNFCYGKGAPLRDRSKAKCFDRVWSTYTQEYRDWFEALPRAQQTEIINGDIKMEADGKFSNGVMAAYQLREEVMQAIAS